MNIKKKKVMYFQTMITMIIVSLGILIAFTESSNLEYAEGIDYYPNTTLSRAVDGNNTPKTTNVVPVTSITTTTTVEITTTIVETTTTEIVEEESYEEEYDYEEDSYYEEEYDYYEEESYEEEEIVYEEEYNDSSGETYYGTFEGTYYEGGPGTYGASGRDLISGYSIASNLFAQGSIVRIEGSGLDGYYRVDDCGGMAGNVIDFYYQYGDVPGDFYYQGRVSIEVYLVS